MKAAFIGLGVMGFPMAGHLARAGHETAVFHRSPEKPRRGGEAHAGRPAATVAGTLASSAPSGGRRLGRSWELLLLYRLNR